jgi:hypothetical protein
MKKILLYSLCLLVIGCTSQDYGPELTEPAEVVEVVYTPGQHGGGLGRSIKGDVSVVDVQTKEVYAVVFACPHGKFIVKDKRLWERSRVGQRGTVVYREVYSFWKSSTHAKTLVDYDFINFIPAGAIQ